MSETNWGNRLKDIADEVKTIGASVDELNQAFCALSEVLREVVQDALDDIAQMQKDMADGFAITNVVERLKEFAVHPVKGKRRTYIPYREEAKNRNLHPETLLAPGTQQPEKEAETPLTER